MYNLLLESSNAFDALYSLEDIAADGEEFSVFTPEEISMFNFFSVAAIIVINLVLIFVIRKILTRRTPFAFNIDSPMFANRKVENVPNWNKQHAKGLMVYDLVLTIVFLYPVFGLEIDGGLIDGLLFIGSIILGLIALLIQHSILSKKYVVKKY